METTSVTSLVESVRKNQELLKTMSVIARRDMKAMDSLVEVKRDSEIVFKLPGSTLHGYLSKILARSCQDLGKILAKILPRIVRCHAKILSREPCSQEKFYCKILFDQKKFRKEVNKNQHLCRYTLLGMIFCKQGINFD